MPLGRFTQGFSKTYHCSNFIFFNFKNGTPEIINGLASKGNSTILERHTIKPPNQNSKLI
jgi:hypothetical protein